MSSRVESTGNTADPSTLLERELIFVTGKGGVGKSTVSSALCLAAARTGKRVLACEFDAKGDLLASFAGAGARGGRGDRPLGYTAREIHPNVFAMAMDPEESLKEYLRLNLKIPIITKIGALSTAFDFLANAAPGIREIVTVGKVAYEVRERNYDIVIVDATASGHIVGQLRAPQAINELVGTGLIRSQTGWMLDILSDTSRTGVVITTSPQEMPVRETIDVVDALQRDTTVDIAGIVVNRVLPEPFVVADKKRFDALRSSTSSAAASAFSSLLTQPAAAPTMIAGAQFGYERRRHEAANIDMLRTALSERAGREKRSPIPSAFVPMLFDAEPGIDMTRQVSEHLVDEWSL